MPGLWSTGWFSGQKCQWEWKCRVGSLLWDCLTILKSLLALFCLSVHLGIGFFHPTCSFPWILKDKEKERWWGHAQGLLGFSAMLGAWQHSLDTIDTMILSVLPIQLLSYGEGGEGHGRDKHVPLRLSFELRTHLNVANVWSGYLQKKNEIMILQYLWNSETAQRLSSKQSQCCPGENDD